MSETLKQSIQLAEFVSAEQATTKNGTPAKKINYKWLDGEEPAKVVSVQYLIGKIPTAELLKTLKEGEQFVVVKEQTPDGKFWNVKEFRTTEGYVAREKKKWSGSGGARYEKKSYDDTGVKVGAARNQAIAILTASSTAFLNEGVSIEGVLDLVDSTAYEIIKRQAAQEANVRAGTTHILTEEPIKPLELAQDEAPW